MDELLSKMKRSAYIVDTSRAQICDRDGIVRALESGQLAGYAGDVWYPQPAPKDHPWRSMPYHGMTPHMSGASLSAQARYAAGTREILECWLQGRPMREEYIIVDGGKLAGTGAQVHSPTPFSTPVFKLVTGKRLLYRPVTGTTELVSIGIARATKGDVRPTGEKFCQILRKISAARAMPSGESTKAARCAGDHKTWLLTHAPSGPAT